MLPKTTVPRQPADAFQNFDLTVRDICAYLGDDEAKTLYIRVARFLRIVVEEMNLYLFVSGVKSVFLRINENMTVDLPRDFQSLSKVGVCCKNGTIRLIGRNDNLCPPKDAPLIECCDCSKGVHEESEVSAVESGGACCSACSFHNVEGANKSSLAAYYGIVNPFYPYLYGYNPKQFVNGTYRFDERNMRLILGDGCDTRPGGEVLLEYNAQMANEKYDLIPKKAIPTIMFKVAFYIKQDKNPSAAQLEFNNFKRHYTQLKKTMHTYTLEDLVAAFRKGYRSSVKR